jgi:hypothetical protein
MHNFVMLSVIMLNVVMLSVAALTWELELKIT